MRCPAVTFPMCGRSRGSQDECMWVLCNSAQAALTWYISTWLPARSREPMVQRCSNNLRNSRSSSLPKEFLPFLDVVSR